jgi:hypothetical protein
VDVIVDDHLLLRLLLDDPPSGLRSAGAQVLTTGLWYHRLCRAVGSDAVIGRMSRSLGAAAPGVAASAISAIIELPATVGLLSLRDLAWPMARLLGGGVRLNLMSLEALAAADYQNAEICLAPADDNVPLRETAVQLGIPVRLVGG